MPKWPSGGRRERRQRSGGLRGILLGWDASFCLFLLVVFVKVFGVLDKLYVNVCHVC